MEDVVRQVGQTGIAGDDVGEGLAIDDVLIQIQVVQTVRIVEPVSFLEAIELFVQYDPECLPDHAVVDMFLGKSANPEIDAVDALHCIVVCSAELNAGVSGGESCEFGRRIENQIGIGLLELVDDRRAQIVALLEIIPGRVGIEIACKSDGFGNI